MAELIVAGLAVASTPPAVFAFERLNDALTGKKSPEKQEQKPKVDEAQERRLKLDEAQDVLPNLLKPNNVVKGYAGKKDVLPNLLKPSNVVKGNADRKEDQKPFLCEAKEDQKPHWLTPKTVLEGSTTNKFSLVSEPFSPKNSSRSTTTAAETEPELPFRIDGIVESDATNPYVLTIPSSYRIEQDTRRIVEEENLAAAVERARQRVRQRNAEKNDKQAVLSICGVLSLLTLP